MNAEQMMTDAERITSLNDWGGETYFENDFRRLFPALVYSVEHEANLAPHGLVAAELRLRSILEARLQFIDTRKKNPAIADEEIRKPLIILGMPRSGSSFLLELMAQDPENRAAETWEMMFPSPPPVAETYTTDPRIARTDAILRAQRRLEPEIQALHPYSTHLHDECHYLMEFTTISDNLTASWRLPTFNVERAKTDSETAYRMHRMVLQMLQYKMRGERWVLKNPGHMFFLPQLFAVYPDAEIVQTHRDPAKVIPSVAALVMAMRRADSDNPISKEKCATGNLRAFASGLGRVTEFRQHSGHGRQFYDLHYLDLIDDPVVAVAKIYAHFGHPLKVDAERRMRAWLQRPESHGVRGKHTLAEYGLDEAMINDHYGDYIAQYGITLERNG